MNEKYYSKKELLLDLQIARETADLIGAQAEIQTDDSKMTPMAKSIYRKAAQMKQLAVIDKALKLIGE